MPFVKAPGLIGKLYIPEKQRNCQKKHPCKDCYSCEHCSDGRCRICRGDKNAADKATDFENRVILSICSHPDCKRKFSTP